MGDKRECAAPHGPHYGNADSTANRVYNEMMRYRRTHDRMFYNIVVSPETFRAQNLYIKMIAAHEGLSQTELAEMLSIRCASVTNALQRLEKNGFVERRPDENDGRVIRVYLAEKGKAILQRIDSDMEELLNTCFKLPDDEAEAFIKTLRKLENGLRNYNETYERRKNEADF